jgi:hypothetical protein
MDVLNSGNLIVISAAKSSYGVVYFDSALDLKIHLFYDVTNCHQVEEY